MRLPAAGHHLGLCRDFGGHRSRPRVVGRPADRAGLARPERGRKYGGLAARPALLKFAKPLRRGPPGGGGPVASLAQDTLGLLVGPFGVVKPRASLVACQTGESHQLGPVEDGLEIAHTLARRRALALAGQLASQRRLGLLARGRGPFELVFGQLEA
jgi:hypothetical protein